LVSRKSRAGKTVLTKYIMKYLATLSHFGNISTKNQVEQQGKFPAKFLIIILSNLF